MHALTLSAALALLFGTASAYAAEPIKLGCVAALSGAGADIGAVEPASAV